MTATQLSTEAIAVLDAADAWLTAVDSDPEGYPYRQTDHLGDLIESLRAWRKARTL